jgi:hypothetical protein
MPHSAHVLDSNQGATNGNYYPSLCGGLLPENMSFVRFRVVVIETTHDLLSEELACRRWDFEEAAEERKNAGCRSAIPSPFQPAKTSP